MMKMAGKHILSSKRLRIIMKQKINSVRKIIDMRNNKKIFQSDTNERLSNGIKKILETEIAPMLAMHGGKAEFVGFKDGLVKIRLKGACRGCALSELTLKEGVGKILKEKIREIKRVENVG